MFYNDAADTVAVEPSRPAAATEGFFTNGDPGLGVPATVLPDWIVNMVLNEFAAILTEWGITRDKTADDQLLEALHGARALWAHDTDTDLAPGSWVIAQNALLCAHSSRAHGNARAIVIACNGGEVSGSNAAAIACWNAGVKALVSGDMSVVMAARDVEAAGDYSAAIASDGCDVTGDKSAALAALDCDVDGVAAVAAIASELCTVGDASTENAAALASRSMTVTADEAASVASVLGSVTGEKSAAVASEGADVQGARAAVIAADDGEALQTKSAVIASGATGDGTIVDKPRSAAIACNRGAKIATGVGGGGSLLVGERCTLADDNTFAMGYHGSVTPGGTANANLKIRMVGTNGDIHYNGSLSAGTADYAEAFPNTEAKEIPPGSIVCLVGDGCQRTGAAGDEILGVVSAAPVIVGDAAPLEWRHRWITDDFGRPITEPLPMIAWDPVLSDTKPRKVRELVRAAFDGPVATAGELPEDAKHYTAKVVTREAYRGPLGDLELEGIEGARVFKINEVLRRPYNGPLHAAPHPLPEEAEFYDRQIPRGPRRRGMRARMAAFVTGNVIPSVRWPELKRRVTMVTWPAQIEEVERVKWRAVYRTTSEPELVAAGYDGPKADAPPVPAGVTPREWTLDAPKENPEYNPTHDYKPRLERPDDYTAVGLLGKLPTLYKGKINEAKLRTGEVKFYLKPGPDGVGTVVKTPTPLRVISIVRAAKGDELGVARVLLTKR